MIDQEETGYSVAAGARTLVGHRWKARMTHALVPAACAATLMLREAWHAHGHSWTRPELLPQLPSQLVDRDD
jgi:hypothetical protein